MKILALGGAGQEGSRTVRDLATSEQVTEVVIGELNISAAEQLISDIGSKKVSCLEIDATDNEKLVAVLKEFDVVVTFVGPYFRFGLPILKAAITAGCNYVDICDDAEPTVEMLDLCEQAKVAGITAVIGAGVSPGTLNVTVRDAADKLDTVEEVHFRWNVPCTDLEGDIADSAALAHGIHIMNGDVTQFLNGEFVKVPAMSGSEMVTYPALGECEAYYLGHPEPVTVPRYFKDIKHVTQKGGCLGFDDVVRGMRELGLTSEQPINVKGQMVRPCDVAVALIGQMPEPTEEELALLPPPITEMFTYVIGTKGNKKIKLTYGVSGAMGPLTGIPASIVAQMIGANEITAQGVFAPEGCVNPGVFFSGLAERGIHVSMFEEELAENSIEDLVTA